MQPTGGSMKLVIIESPYAGNVLENILYARKCVRHSLEQGEAPIASHLLYTQAGILDDSKAEERKQGIDAGIAWYGAAQECIVYNDHGITEGMRKGINKAKSLGIPVTYRKILEPDVISQIQEKLFKFLIKNNVAPSRIYVGEKQATKLKREVSFLNNKSFKSGELMLNGKVIHITEDESHLEVA